MPEAEIVRLLHVAREQNRNRPAAPAEREQPLEDRPKRSSLRRAEVQGVEDKRGLGNCRAGEGPKDQRRVPDDSPGSPS